MVKKFKKFLCYIGLHDWWYMPPDHPEWHWHPYTIMGCDYYKCKRCLKNEMRGYPEHAHEHTEPTRKVLKQPVDKCA